MYSISSLFLRSNFWASSTSRIASLAWQSSSWTLSSNIIFLCVLWANQTHSSQISSCQSAQYNSHSLQCSFHFIRSSTVSQLMISINSFRGRFLSSALISNLSLPISFLHELKCFHEQLFQTGSMQYFQMVILPIDMKFDQWIHFWSCLRVRDCLASHWWIDFSMSSGSITFLLHKDLTLNGFLVVQITSSSSLSVFSGFLYLIFSFVGNKKLVFWGWEIDVLNLSHVSHLSLLMLIFLS